MVESPLPRIIHVVVVVEEVDDDVMEDTMDCQKTSAILIM
jgi:hypothetical protein